MAAIRESLSQFTFPAGPWIEETHVKLGQGRYGPVYTVKIRGLQCAGKKFDAGLFEESTTDVGTEEGSGAGKRFVEQCLQLSQVRHPNVVQLLGVFFDSKSVPTLVTEVLPLNLHKCLEDYHHIPNYAKSSILLDVASGLRYVHEQKQPIVHGRLCAEKILLTISLQAKICGFVNPLGVALPDSSYTPPEAAEGPLTLKGDVFSFGNLMLHVGSQNYPQPTGKEKQDPNNQEQTVTCTEVERREHSLKELGDSHALQGLMKWCLEDDPNSRPSTAELLREIEQHALSTPPPYASILQVMQEVEQATLLKENIAALTQTIDGKQAELDAKQLEVDGLMQELEVKEKAVFACKEELEAYKQTVHSKERRMQMHDQALRAKDSLIKAKARELVAKNQQLTAKETQLAAANRRIGTLEERLATGKASPHGLRFSSTPQRSPVRSPAMTRSQQVSPTFKESPYKFNQSAEAEDLTVKASEVLRRSVPGRRGKTVPMSDGIFFHNARFDPQKSNIYGQQPVDPKLAAILAKRHQRYEDVESNGAPKQLEQSQQIKSQESTPDHVQLRKRQDYQRLRSSSAASGMSPELHKMMEKRRSQVDMEPIDLSTEKQHKTPPPTAPRERHESSPSATQQQKVVSPPVESSPNMEQQEPSPPEIQQQESESSEVKPPPEQDSQPPEPQPQEVDAQREPEPSEVKDPEPPPSEQDSAPQEQQQEEPSQVEQPEQQEAAPAKVETVV